MDPASLYTEYSNEDRQQLSSGYYNMESLNDRECDETPRSQSSTDNTAAITGEVVAVVLIIAILVFAMTVFLAMVWKSHHGTKQNTEE